MRILRNISIRNKITIISILTCMIVLLLVLATFVVIEIVMTKSAMVEQVSTLGEVIGANSTAALIFNDGKAAEGTLAALCAESGIISAAIYTRDGKLFARYLCINRGNDTPSSKKEVYDWLNVDQTAFLKSERYNYRFLRDNLELFTRIMHDGEIIGVVYIKSNLSALQERLQWYIGIAAMVMLPALFIAYLLSSRFQQIISKPILYLAQTMRKVSEEKNYSVKVDKQSEDELGTLIDGFNEMLAQIKKRDAELEFHRDLLEEEVAARTVELRESEEKYRALMNNAGEGILLSDTQGNLLEANKRMEKLLDYPEAELLNMSFSQIYQNEEENREGLAFAEIVQKGSSSLDHGWAIRQDGKRIPVEITASVVEYAGNTVVQSIFKDISERKRAEEERLVLSKLESLGLLAGGIAHDFNNILTAILGNINLAMLAPELTDKFMKRLGEAEKACFRAQALASQLLSFSKGGQPIKKTTSLGELLQESVNLALSGSKAYCELSLPEDLWFVEVDEGQISQVIGNLLINADQAMPSGGKIAVKAQNVTAEEGSSLPKGKYVKVTIADQGIGISPKYLDKIFDPYFTTKQKGSGLGLASAHTIVKNHGGHITVASEAGLGTTFSIYLPAGEMDIALEKKVELYPMMGYGRVLIMDDEEIIRDVLGRMLQELSYEPSFAKDGTEAVELYKQGNDEGRPFTAVILDLTIPGGMGGKETIGQLIAIDPQVKAIVSSGYSEHLIMADFQKYGFKGIIAKPYRFTEFSKVLHDMIMGEDVEKL